MFEERLNELLLPQLLSDHIWHHVHTVMGTWGSHCSMQVATPFSHVSWRHQQAQRRMEQHQCLAVMAGRGALVKPWLFQEWQSNQEWLPTAAERVSVYR